MKIRVYFYRETDPETILRGNKIGRQAWILFTISFGKESLRTFLM